LRIWSLAIDLSDSSYDVATDLSAEEADRARQLRFAADRRRYLASRHWLRRVLAECLGIDPAQIDYGASATGKPLLAMTDQSELRFSLSRSGGFALYALAVGREVGVDIQEYSAGVDFRAVARRVLSPAEKAVLRVLDAEAKQRAFFRIWARKEAFVKAAGVGLSVPLDVIDVTGEVVRVAGHLDGVPLGHQWSVRDLEVEPGYGAAVAVQGGFLPQDAHVVRRLNSD
jgi:4'-phosphopantetheinyl transferase